MSAMRASSAPARIVAGQGAVQRLGAELACDAGAANVAHDAAARSAYRLAPAGVI